MKLSKGTIVRTALLLLALINTSLQLAGVEVLPFAPGDVEIAVTVGFNVVAALAAWWKNNSFTKSAKKADGHLAYLKSRSKSQSQTKGER